MGKPTVHRSEEGAGIPFRMSKSRPLLIVEAFVNGEGPFNFAVDTGASVTVVSPRVAKKASLTPSRKAAAKAIGAGGQLDTRLAKLESLVLGTVEVKHLRVAVMSLSAVGRAIHLRLDGILGYNLLKNYRVTIDYPNGVVLLQSAPPRPKTARPTGTAPRSKKAR
jgi:predicted aspartyl protease